MRYTRPKLQGMRGPGDPQDVIVVGVDGCRSGWLAASLSPSKLQFCLSVHRTIAELWDAHAGVAAIAIDIPIGLSECFAPRRCDQEARALLGPRRSSVFPAPDRRLLHLNNYADANAFSRRQCGKGISQQSFHIFRKIAEVDTFLTPAKQSRLFEAHPELCFWAASRRRHLIHPKRTPEGFEERRLILQQILPGIAIGPRSEVAQGLAGAHPDDVLDAMITAWTALLHATGRAARVPSDPEYDPRGLRMEIVF